MRDSNFGVDNAAIKQHQKEILLNTKRQYMKESNMLVGNVTIKQHQKEILLNTEGKYMMESNSNHQATSKGVKEPTAQDRFCITGLVLIEQAGQVIITIQRNKETWEHIEQRNKTTLIYITGTNHTLSSRFFLFFPKISDNIFSDNIFFDNIFFDNIFFDTYFSTHIF